MSAPYPDKNEVAPEYSPPGGAYPPPNVNYPPPAGGYAPPAGGYAPPAGGFAPVGVGYAPAQGGGAAYGIQQTTQVHVVTQQPGGQYPQNIRDFSSGLCDCFTDCSSCAYAFFCFTCFACTQATRVGEDCCCAGCWLAPTSWIAMRTKLRTMYGIRGSICEDYCCVMCCTQLTMCQMSREMDHFGL